MVQSPASLLLEEEPETQGCKELFKVVWPELEPGLSYSRASGFSFGCLKSSLSCWFLMRGLLCRIQNCEVRGTLDY